MTTEEQLDPDSYEPQPTYVKKNAIATVQTLQIQVLQPADNNEHPFIPNLTTPLVVQNVDIFVSGIVGQPLNQQIQSITIGPKGNAVFPVLPFTHFNTFSKTDINQIFYQNASGVMVYFMYSGSARDYSRSTC